MDPLLIAWIASTLIAVTVLGFLLGDKSNSEDWFLNLSFIAVLAATVWIWMPLAMMYSIGTKLRQLLT